MNPGTEALVHRVIAEHLDIDASSLQPSSMLEDDLGLTPLAVILVVLDIEDLVDAFVTFEHLMKVRTVADLTALFRDSELRVEGRPRHIALPHQHRL